MSGVAIASAESLCWPLSRLGEAVEALARRSGLAHEPIEAPPPPASLAQANDEVLGRWIEALTSAAGLEAESTQASYADAERVVTGAGPALLRFPGKGQPRFLVLLGGGRGKVALLGPDLMVRRLSPATVRADLCREREAPVVPEVERLMEEAGVAPRRRARARVAILRQRLGATPIGGCWVLRLRPGTRFWSQVRDAGLPRRLLALVAGHAIQYGLWLLSWWMVGKAALEGRLDKGWLLAWALLLLTIIPFQLLVTWLQGRLAIGAGALLKQRMLVGALRLEPEEIRREGVGQLLGRVVESEAMESLALSGGFLALVSAIELVLAGGVLILGAGGFTAALLLATWVAVTLLLSRRYLRQRAEWTEARLGMTHDLVEGMVGHRTRLAQEEREGWHLAEDAALERYLEASRALDRTAALITAVIPRGWLVLGLLALTPGFVGGSGSPPELAVAIGGMLLAHRALRRLATGITHVAGAVVAWRQVAPLFEAAARPDVDPSPVVALSQPGAVSGDGDAPLLEAHNLVFRHQGRGDTVLRGCTLEIGAGERVLLQGASGGGKSTLASLLSGLRAPESGLLLVGGLDRHTLGVDGWRRRVVAAPQFHENHVLTGTFAFNALMGREWPPDAEDAKELEAVCHGLGLGDLLARMPAGMLQMVGESGWQLSHGEKSRLYIARALLQGADLLLLDESFAALDPENLKRCLQYVLERAGALLVIAHP